MTIATVWSDTFAGRTVGAGSWGTASDGETYTQYQGNTSHISVSSGEGISAGTTADNVVIMRLGSTTGIDMEATIRFSIGTTSASAGVCDQVCLMARITDSVHYYRLDAGSLGNNLLRLGYKNGGGFNQIASATSPLTLTANTFYWIRFRIKGTNLYGRIWADGSGEPIGWHITGTDSTIATAGGIGMSLNCGSGANSTQKVDSFSATTLQSTNTYLQGNHKSFARIR